MRPSAYCRRITAAAATRPTRSRRKTLRPLSSAHVVLRRPPTATRYRSWLCAMQPADPAQLAKEREQRRKELEKQKLETTVRHRTLAEVLEKVSAPMERADLALVANAMLDKTEPLRRETLARRHKVVDGAANEITYPQVQKGLQHLLRQLDESGLSKLIVEIALLGSVESAAQDENDPLLTAARRHRVDVTKLRKTVEAEFVAREAKLAAKRKQPVKQPSKAA